mmetsp:Transcript_23200/g.62880  ORF Transcript_23200/g.62880 Transcript_23200/m.62880 type:complete len:532 (+) Transcript_23200:514-2109(+)
MRAKTRTRTRASSRTSRRRTLTEGGRPRQRRTGLRRRPAPPRTWSAPRPRPSPAEWRWSPSSRATFLRYSQSTQTRPRGLPRASRRSWLRHSSRCARAARARRARSPSPKRCARSTRAPCTPQSISQSSWPLAARAPRRSPARNDAAQPPHLVRARGGPSRGGHVAARPGHGCSREPRARLCRGHVSRRGAAGGHARAALGAAGPPHGLGPHSLPRHAPPRPRVGGARRQARARRIRGAYRARGPRRGEARSGARRRAQGSLPPLAPRRIGRGRGRARVRGHGARHGRVALGEPVRLVRARGAHAQGQRVREHDQRRGHSAVAVAPAHDARHLGQHRQVALEEAEGHGPQAGRGHAVQPNELLAFHHEQRRRVRRGLARTLHGRAHGARVGRGHLEAQRLHRLFGRAVVTAGEGEERRHLGRSHFHARAEVAQQPRPAQRHLQRLVRPQRWHRVGRGPAGGKGVGVHAQRLGQVRVKAKRVCHELHLLYLPHGHGREAAEHASALRGTHQGQAQVHGRQTHPRASVLPPSS